MREGVERESSAVLGVLYESSSSDEKEEQTLGTIPGCVIITKTLERRSERGSAELFIHRCKASFGYSIGILLGCEMARE